jgi:peptide deformylase
MAIREIITPPNPILRQPAQPVRELSSETQMLIDDMIETMRAAPGVGLAAPQVAVDQRIIVIEFAEDETEDEDEPAAEPRLYVVINPEIVRHAQETVAGNEGCLSLPGYMGEVDRFSWVSVEGMNRHGLPFKIQAQDWLARIFQHEIDHLNGVLYIDRANKVWRMNEVEAEQTSRV